MLNILLITVIRFVLLLPWQLVCGVMGGMQPHLWGGGAEPTGRMRAEDGLRAGGEGSGLQVPPADPPTHPELPEPQLPSAVEHRSLVTGENRQPLD